jgi:hypothetical protein
MYEDAKEDLLYYTNTSGMVFVSIDDGDTVITPEGRRINTATQLTPTDEARDVGEMYDELTPAQRAHVDPWLEDYQSTIDTFEALSEF